MQNPLPNKNDCQSQLSASILGVVLVGGQSKRMGFAKESAPIYDECTMLEHIVKIMSDVCANILIVGKTEDRLGVNLSKYNNVIFSLDSGPGLGPLSGITTALEFARPHYAGCLVIACDQPLVQSETLRLLIHSASSTQVVFFQGENAPLFQPLPGYFPLSSQPGLKHCLDTGLLSLRKAITYLERIGIPLLRLSLAKNNEFQLTSANDLETLEKVRLCFANHT